MFRAPIKRMSIVTFGIPFLRGRAESLQHIKSFGGWSLASGTRRGLVAGHLRVVRWSLHLLRYTFDHENVLIRVVRVVAVEFSSTLIRR